MKVTFIDPPNLVGRKNFERVFGCTYSLYPVPNIFSLSAAAVLENNGFSVDYLDMANEGWDLHKIRNYLLFDDSAVIVLHSINLSMQSDMVFHQLIRSLNKNCVIIFMGPAPTYFGGYFLKDTDTFVVRGEPEITILELINSLSGGSKPQGIEGISFRDSDGNIVINDSRPPAADLDSLPFPARHLLNKKLYYNPKLPKLPFSAMQTSRNCSYPCVFCVPNSYNFARELEYRKYHNDQKPPVRLRSAGNVIKEFVGLGEAGYKSVSIIDDQFLWGEERTIKICQGIKKLEVQWGCLARADHITEEIAAHLKEASCRYIDIGVESFNQQVLDDVHKQLDITKVYKAIEILKKYSFIVKINLVLGLSRIQNRQMILEDIRAAKKLDVDMVMFSLATPFPGTELYRIAEESKLFSSGGYTPRSVQSEAIIEYPGLRKSELDWLIKKANISFYLRPRILFRNMKLFLSPIMLYRSLIALKRKFL